MSVNDGGLLQLKCRGAACSSSTHRGCAEGRYGDGSIIGGDCKMAQVGRTVVRERRACAIQDFARGSVARASGDNTLKKYTKTKKAKQYTEKQGARARKGPHIKRYPVAQIPVGLEHAAGRGSRQVGANCRRHSLCTGLSPVLPRLLCSGALTHCMKHELQRMASLRENTL